MANNKKTIKEKTIYQIYREKADFTRESASETMEYKYGLLVSSDRLYKVEKETVAITPSDVMAMAKCYKAPELCNYYCSHECPIGQQYVPEVQVKELSQIVLETINSLNNLEKQKNRLIEISVDGQITKDEYEDFIDIQKNLKHISMAIDSLQLWLEKTIAEGKIDSDLLNKLI